MATGGGYGSVSASLGLFVEDDENPELVISPTTLALREGGGTGRFTVKTGGAVSTGKTVTVALSSGDSGAVTVSPASLTFSSATWNTNQTVTVTPVQDADNDNESVTVTATASGDGFDRESGTVTVAESLTKPAQVSGVTVTPLSGSLKVSWTAVTSATGYKVQ